MWGEVGTSADFVPGNNDHLCLLWLHSGGRGQGWEPEMPWALGRGGEKAAVPALCFRCSGFHLSREVCGKNSERATENDSTRWRQRNSLSQNSEQIVGFREQWTVGGGTGEPPLLAEDPQTNLCFLHITQQLSKFWHGLPAEEMPVLSPDCHLHSWLTSRKPTTPAWAPFIGQSSSQNSEKHGLRQPVYYAGHHEGHWGTEGWSPRGWGGGVSSPVPPLVTSLKISTPSVELRRRLQPKAGLIPPGLDVSLQPLPSPWGVNGGAENLTLCLPGWFSWPPTPTLDVFQKLPHKQKLTCGRKGFFWTFLEIFRCGQWVLRSWTLPPKRFSLCPGSWEVIFICLGALGRCHINWVETVLNHVGSQSITHHRYVTKPQQKLGTLALGQTSLFGDSCCCGHTQMWEEWFSLTQGERTRSLSLLGALHSVPVASPCACCHPEASPCNKPNPWASQAPADAVSPQKKSDYC